jgi:hypothetical protein
MLQAGKSPAQLATRSLNSSNELVQESSWGKGLPVRKADKLTAISKPMWKPQLITIVWVSTACCRDSFTFYYSVVLK